MLSVLHKIVLDRNVTPDSSLSSNPSLFGNMTLLMLGLTSICTFYILHLEPENPPLIWFPPVLWLVKSTRDFCLVHLCLHVKMYSAEKKSLNPTYITFKYKYISRPTAPCTQSKWCLTSQVCFQRPVPCLEVERPCRCTHIKRTFGLRCIFIPSLPLPHPTHARIHPHIQHWMDPFRGFCPAIPFILPAEG